MTDHDGKPAKPDDTGDDPLPDLAYLYALDAISDAQRDRIDARVRNAPAAQRREFLANAAATYDLLGQFADGTALAAPEGLRQRLIQATETPSQAKAARTPLRVFQARHQRGVRRALVAAAALAMIGAGTAVGIAIWPQPAPGNEKIIAAAPDRNTATANVTGGGTISVTYSRQRQMAMIQMNGVAAPPPGMVYQLWTKADAAHSAGLMTGDDLKSTRIITGIAAVTAIAVTVEPAGGSPTPTSDPVAVAPLA